ncbi:MAG: hypothetical protein FWG69_06310 [Oscillospiraceae bacterium]|nr:hypothetical protein [Oscillospiraceae bacterium]
MVFDDTPNVSVKLLAMFERERLLTVLRTENYVVKNLTITCRHSNNVQLLQSWDFRLLLSAGYAGAINRTRFTDGYSRHRPCGTLERGLRPLLS